MYKGRRDAEVSILVPQNFCEVYRDKNSIKWIEVFIPSENGMINGVKDIPFGSIMVKPEQVFYFVEPDGQTDRYNVITINSNANIVNSAKDAKRNIIASEFVTEVDIIGRLLKSLTCDVRKASAVYDDWFMSGLTMYAYITKAINERNKYVAFEEDETGNVDSSDASTAESDAYTA